MARVVRGCSLVLSWGEGEGVVDKGGWGGWVLVASSDVMSAMLGEEEAVICQGGIDKKKTFVHLFCLKKNCICTQSIAKFSINEKLNAQVFFPVL